MTRRPALPQKLAAAAHEELASLGVRILVDTRVTEVDRLLAEGVLRVRAAEAALLGALEVPHLR